MLKGVLWDNDGVLVDTEYLFFLANKALLNNYNLDVTVEEYFDWYLNQNRGVWHLFEQIDMHEDEFPALRETRNQIFQNIIQNEKDLTIPGIQPVLQAMHQKVQMGIVTSAYKENFDVIHSKVPLRQYFDFVLTSEDYEQCKPSPEPYLLGLDKMGLAPDECIVVEDSPRGLQAAIAANIRCIVLRHEMTKSFNFDGAYRVVSSTRELHEVLDELI